MLQAYLHRTEQDCKDLAMRGSRVRLCKGAYKEPESVAFQGKAEVRLSYVRCLKALMAGDGYPMVASHDPKLIEIAGALVEANHREKGTYEYQMLFGIRPDEQKRLVAAGEKVRVYVPYGDQWYGYLIPPGPRLHAQRAGRVGVGLRLERRHRDGHRPHPPPAGEDRDRPFVTASAGHGARRRLPVRRVPASLRLVAILGPIAFATLVTIRWGTAKLA